MAKLTGTAKQFVMQTLAAHPDREIEVGEVHDMANAKFSKENLHNALSKLLPEGVVVRNSDGNRSAWWAIAVPG